MQPLRVWAQNGHITACYQPKQVRRPTHLQGRQRYIEKDLDTGKVRNRGHFDNPSTIISNGKITTKCQPKSLQENVHRSLCPFYSNIGEAWLDEVFRTSNSRGEGLVLAWLCNSFPLFSWADRFFPLGLSFFIYKMVNLHSEGLAALRFNILEYFKWSYLPSSIISLQRTLLA